MNCTVYLFNTKAEVQKFINERNWFFTKVSYSYAEQPDGRWKLVF